MAEQEGFELAVPFGGAKPRRVRKLQTAKHPQRISGQNSTQKSANSPVSVRPPFASLRRTPSDSVAESGHFESPRLLIGFATTACLAGSHKIEIFIPRKGCRKGSGCR